MILTRLEFSDHFESVHVGLGAADSPLWIPEHELTDPCNWFICIEPIALQRTGRKEQFWDWTKKILRGQVRCFSSSIDGGEEWWGFTHKEDIVLFVLRWA